MDVEFVFETNSFLVPHIHAKSIPFYNNIVEEGFEPDENNVIHVPISHDYPDSSIKNYFDSLSTNDVSNWDDYSVCLADFLMDDFRIKKWMNQVNIESIKYWDILPTCILNYFCNHIDKLCDKKKSYDRKLHIIDAIIKVFGDRDCMQILRSTRFSENELIHLYTCKASKVLTFIDKTRTCVCIGNEHKLRNHHCAYRVKNLHAYNKIYDLAKIMKSDVPFYILARQYGLYRIDDFGCEQISINHLLLKRDQMKEKIISHWDILIKIHSCGPVFFDWYKNTSQKQIEKMESFEDFKDLYDYLKINNYL